MGRTGCSPRAPLSMGFSQQEYWDGLPFLFLLKVLLSKGSLWPRDQARVSCVSCFNRQILYQWATWEFVSPYRQSVFCTIYWKVLQWHLCCKSDDHVYLFFWTILFYSLIYLFVKTTCLRQVLLSTSAAPLLFYSTGLSLLPLALWFFTCNLK